VPNSLDWRHWALTHAIWIVAAIVAILLGHSWIAEHDARLHADDQIKASEALIKTLQDHQAATDAAAAQKVQVITKIVHDAVTPTQVVAALPQVDKTIAANLGARIAPSLQPSEVAVQAVPLMQLVGDFANTKTQLDACQSNLADEKSIAANKDDEIKALKKKPSFWKRVGGTAKMIGIGIGIGALLGAHL
jgi:hypothetical protein